MTAEVTVTFKGDKGYDAPWLVFKGDPADVQQAIITAAGLTSEQAHGLPLVETALVVNKQFQDLYKMGVALGAVPITQEAQDARPPIYEVKAGSEDPTGQATPADIKPPEPASPHAGLISQIASAPSLDAIQNLWVSNQAAFDDAAVQQAVAERRQQIGA